MIKQVFLASFFFCISLLHAQPFSVSGKLTDSKDNSPLIGVNVTLTNIKDTLLVKGVSTDLEGSFIITDVDSGTYVLNISYISYKSIVKNISVTENLDLKLIPMAEESKLLKEVLIQEKQIRVQQLGDTAQFTASSFKVNKDATTEDLLTKMPGVTAENGTVKVN